MKLPPDDKRDKPNTPDQKRRPKGRAAGTTPVSEARRALEARMVSMQINITNDERQALFRLAATKYRGKATPQYVGATAIRAYLVQEGLVDNTGTAIPEKPK